MLPYCWEVGVLIGQVVEICKILNTPWSKVFQLEDSDTICIGTVEFLQVLMALRTWDRVKAAAWWSRL